jgi:cystathionine beta-lyase family protein involved in aluminum resistance
MFYHIRHRETLKTLSDQIEEQIRPVYHTIEQIVEHNQVKVLNAFHQAKVSDFHFANSTGYGYHDSGRDVLEQVYADIFHTEAALVRPHIVSGTHAIAASFFGLLRPGDELLYLSGTPYDTLKKVIGRNQGDGDGTLADWGIGYREVPLDNNGKIDLQRFRSEATEKTKVVAIQRSRGYADRPSFQVAEINEAFRYVKTHYPEAVTFVDNCYGEFVEEDEPDPQWTDVIAGSLIKNPGGGLAPSGGYIAGKAKLIRQIAYRVTAPGIGAEVGAMLGSVRPILQGVFLAPHVVGEALKGAVYSSAMLAAAGFETKPLWFDRRSDIVQAIRFNHPAQLIAFCQEIQHASPIDAHVTPRPAKIPGYDHPVVMAAGTFIQGGSLELSADGPIRPPYIGYMQGGLTREHVKYATLRFLDRIHDEWKDRLLTQVTGK